MPFKIVHCADLHIGTSLSGLSTDAFIQRNEEIRTVFLDMINFCKEKSVDALLICGDLFDCPIPTENDRIFVKNALSSIGNTDVFIVCGNHDYMCPGSPYSDPTFFSQNVHIFPCFEHAFSIPEKNAVIWGKSYNSRTIEPSFDKCNFDESKINIMCLHGDMFPKSDYNILTKETLSSLPCDYAAFGHIHKGYISQIASVPYAYCGALEGQSFSDDGFTGFIYGEIAQESAEFKQISFSKRHYRNISLDVSYSNTSQIISDAKKIINDTDLFRLTLEGEYTNPTDINISLIKSELEKIAFYIDIFDNTSAGYDFDKIESEEGIRGEFLRELRNLCKTEEEFILSAKAGLDALSGRIPDIGGEIC